MFLDKSYFLLCFFFVLHYFNDTSWFRQISDTKDLYWFSSRSRSDALSFPILHPSYLSCSIVGDDDISDFECSCHDDNGRDYSLFRISMCINDDSHSRSIRIIFEIKHFCLKQDCFEKLRYSLTCL